MTNDLLVVALVALGALTATAETFTYDGPLFSILLTEAPCQNEGLKKDLYALVLTSAKIAVIHIKGKAVGGCWQGVDDDNLYLIDEAGHRGMLPLGAFRRAPSS